LDHLIAESIRTKHWRERNGLIEKKFERLTSVTVRLEGSLDGALEKGVYKLIVTPEEADTVYASETGHPDPTLSGKVSGRSYETSASRVWFLPVDSRGEAKSGASVEWLAPVKLAVHAASTSTGTTIDWTIVPRSAEVRASFDGSDPMQGSVVASPLTVPASVKEVRLVPMVDGRSGEEVRLDPGGGTEAQPRTREIRDDRPLLLRHALRFDSITRLTDAMTALQAATGAAVRGGQIEIGAEDGDVFADITFGEGVAMSAEAVTAVIASVAQSGGFTATRASASFNETRFASGKDYKVFADAVGLDFESMKWAQDEDV